MDRPLGDSQLKAAPYETPSNQPVQWRCPRCIENNWGNLSRTHVNITTRIQVTPVHMHPRDVASSSPNNRNRLTNAESCGGATSGPPYIQPGKVDNVARPISGSRAKTIWNGGTGTESCWANFQSNLVTEHQMNNSNDSNPRLTTLKVSQPGPETMLHISLHNPPERWKLLFRIVYKTRCQDVPNCTTCK